MGLMDDTREKILDRHSCNVVHPPPILGIMKVINDNNDNDNKQTKIVDMDEENQQKQYIFFSKLAQFWYDNIIYSTSSFTTITINTNMVRKNENTHENTVDDTAGDDTNEKVNNHSMNENMDNNNSMVSFLEQCAVDHMGWDDKKRDSDDNDRKEQSKESIKRVSSNESLEDKFKMNHVSDSNNGNKNNDMGLHVDAFG